MELPTDSLTLQLWELLTTFEARLGAELSPLGLSVSSFRLVGEVMGEPDGIRQGELARRLGVRPPTVSAAVARLEAADILRRLPDPRDSRARLVCLAPDAPLQAGLDVLQRIDTLLCDDMSPDEEGQTRTMLTDLQRKLAAEEPA